MVRRRAVDFESALSEQTLNMLWLDPDFHFADSDFLNESRSNEIGGSRDLGSVHGIDA